LKGAPAFVDPDRGKRLGAGLEQLDELFGRFREEHRIPGLAYGVVIDGELVKAGAIGTADVRAGTEAHQRSVFRIASVTKSVTACCVCRLRDAGAFSLDDPVDRSVPELIALVPATADSAPLTIRQLLTMSGGLVNDDAWADRQLAMPSEAFSALLARGFPFDLAPGTGFEYSNLGYAILGRVVANVAGAPVSELSRKWIFEPLEMTDTIWHADRLESAKAVRGYQLEDDGWVAQAALADGAFGPMGGLCTTVRDFARYTAMHLSAWPPRNDSDDGPLRRSTLREMAQPWRSGQDVFDPAGVVASGYGYGLVSAMHERDGHLVAHMGGLPGFGSHVEWLPEHGVGIMAFANLTYAPARLAVRRAFDVLAATGGLQPRRPVASPELLAAQQWLMGLYEQWDDRQASSHAADNLFLDLAIDRRRAVMTALRSAHGPCVELTRLIPEGSLRGRWRMRCAAGVLEARVALSPTRGPRVQAYAVTASEDDKWPS